MLRTRRLLHSSRYLHSTHFGAFAQISLRTCLKFGNAKNDPPVRYNLLPYQKQDHDILSYSTSENDFSSSFYIFWKSFQFSFSIRIYIVSVTVFIDAIENLTINIKFIKLLADYSIKCSNYSKL